MPSVVRQDIIIIVIIIIIIIIIVDVLPINILRKEIGPATWLKDNVVSYCPKVADLIFGCHGIFL